jgi:hypothetical protein
LAQRQKAAEEKQAFRDEEKRKMAAQSEALRRLKHDVTTRLRWTAAF